MHTRAHALLSLVASCLLLEGVSAAVAHRDDSSFGVEGAVSVVVAALLIIGAGFIYLFCVSSNVAPIPTAVEGTLAVPLWLPSVAPMCPQNYFIWDGNKTSDRMAISIDGKAATCQDDRSTHVAMSKAGVINGKHAFEIIVPTASQGTMLSVGVGYKGATLSFPKAIQLVGNDKFSWGWDAVTKRVLHKGTPARLNRYAVPFCGDIIRVYIDADSGDVGFGTQHAYWGDAFRYEKSNTEPIYLMAAVTVKFSTVIINYLGSVGSAPLIQQGSIENRPDVQRLPPIYMTAYYLSHWPTPPQWLNETVTPTVPIEERGFDSAQLSKGIYFLDNNWIRTQFHSPAASMSVMARGKTGFTSGRHVFYIRFVGDMGTHCWVGIGTDNTKLTLEAKRDSILGKDRGSLGFDLVRRKSFYDGKVNSYPPASVGVSADEVNSFIGVQSRATINNDILMFLDMDNKTLSFGSHALFFGDCMRGFVPKHFDPDTKYYPFVGTTSNDMMMQLIYIGKGCPREYDVSAFNWYVPQGDQCTMQMMVDELYTSTTVDAPPPAYTVNNMPEKHPQQNGNAPAQNPSGQAIQGETVQSQAVQGQPVQGQAEAQAAQPGDTEPNIKPETGPAPVHQAPAVESQTEHNSTTDPQPQ